MNGEKNWITSCANNQNSSEKFLNRLMQLGSRKGKEANIENSEIASRKLEEAYRDFNKVLN